MRALALSALLALLISAPSLAASPAPAQPKQPAKPPSSLWGKYPLGNEKLKPLSVPTPRTTTGSRSLAPTRTRAQTSQTPPSSESGGGGGASIPLWAVLLGALALSCVLGLAGESLVGRAKRLVRPPKPYELVQHAPAEPADEYRPPPEPEPLSVKPGRVRSDGSLTASVEGLRAAAAGLGYDDPKLQAVVEAVTVSGEWRPLSLATVLASWEEPTAVKGARSEVSRSQSQGGMIMGSGYADLGHRVAAVLHAAEEVAVRIREEAREEAAAIRRDAEDAATARVAHLTQEAELLHAKAEEVLAEAEAQARARNEAAEETAARIEAEAIKHQDDLNAAARALEERLQTALAGLELVSTNAEQVLTSADQPEDGNSGPQTLSA